MALVVFGGVELGFDVDLEILGELNLLLLLLLFFLLLFFVFCFFFFVDDGGMMMISKKKKKIKTIFHSISLSLYIYNIIYKLFPIYTTSAHYSPPNQTIPPIIISIFNKNN